MYFETFYQLNDISGKPASDSSLNNASSKKKPRAYRALPASRRNYAEGEREGRSFDPAVSSCSFPSARVLPLTGCLIIDISFVNSQLR